jgi:hypothetical protein
MVTASATTDFRSGDSRGTVAATNLSAGRKIPAVATAAPTGPPSR